MIFPSSAKEIEVLDYGTKVHVRKLSGDAMNEMFRLMEQIAKGANADNRAANGNAFQGHLLCQAVALLLCDSDGGALVQNWKELKPEPFDALQNILHQGLEHNHLTEDSFEELSGNLPRTDSGSNG